MKRRLISIFCLISLGMGGLILRFYSISSQTGLTEAASRQGTKTLTVGTTRGTIYDHCYQKLVNEEKIYLASVLPTPQSAAVLLEHIPTLSRAQVLAQLQKGELFAVELETPIGADTAELHTFPLYRRYREDPLAVHLIGHLTNGGQDGGYGIEKAYDTFLKAQSTTAKITYELDAGGEPIAGKSPRILLEENRRGGVVLTLDKQMQQIVEEVGESHLEKGAVVVMTPSGQIRACASFPDFDPNDLRNSLADQENQPMFNRAFAAYSVGSSFKIVTAVAGLKSGVSETRRYDCSGRIDLDGQKIRCHLHTGHGSLNLAQAMAESCNPYFISLGLLLDPAAFLQTAADFSFGKSSLLAPDLVTQSGSLPDLSELSTPAGIANLSFGQGSLTATPIQVALMTCCIVNGGKTPFAKLVEGLTLDGETLSEEYPDSAPIHAVSEAVADKIRRFLVSGVMDRANQEAKPTLTTAGGKTATAQTGQYDPNGEEICQGWFTGFFPAEDPQLVVTVLCEGAESGNRSAGPIFREIADRITKECGKEAF